MLNKANRLKKRKEFNYIYKKGQLAHSANFTVHYVRAFKPYAQIGISVSKNVGNSVVRSRVKRIISEACRLNIEKFAIKNYIITAKPSIADKKSTEVETELLALLKKNGLMKTENVKDKNVETAEQQKGKIKSIATKNVETKTSQKNVATRKAETQNIEKQTVKKQKTENIKTQNVEKNVEKTEKTKVAKSVAGKGKNV